ncbi:MAG TPA: protein-L-isoaspartate(D-aspartate) O-methyltransferase [Thermoanaerobaculia bacterium]|nr:protein-L-isoaspartate(D-aspartate) O-methyltransferase [Thermoanaerobaculia bacterium]
MTAERAGGDDYAKERAAMVRTQIRARGVADQRVLRAMERVERHRFVPDELQARAYEDYPLPIGHEQTISQPYIVALMSELLELEGDEKVLEIGTGSGYQAAVLGELADRVYTIEIVEPLAERARALLAELGYDQVHVRAGDGYRGWPEEAPFDAIMLTAAPREIPHPLIEQLALGGLLVAPVGDVDQELSVLQKTATGLERRAVIPVRFVPMTGEAQERH